MQVPDFPKQCSFFFLMWPKELKDFWHTHTAVSMFLQGHVTATEGWDWGSSQLTV